MSCLFDYTINSKEDLKYINKDSKIRNLYINFSCKLDGYYCTNLYLNTDAIIINCIIDESLVVSKPKEFILIRNCMIGDVKCSDIGNYNASLHIEHNVIYDNLCLNNFIDDGKDVTVYIYQNQIDGSVKILNEVNTLNAVSICVSSNRFQMENKECITATKPQFIDVKDNYYIDGYNIKFIEHHEFDNHSGYNRKCLGNASSFYVLENHYRLKHLVSNQILKIKNIPQYVSNDNDPALKTGCEATACAIALSYILNKDISKNEIVSYMTMGDPGVHSFWDAFIGDIYNDGWGCMSSVSVNAIKKYLKANGLNDNYYVVNTTNMPLYELLGFVNSGIPVIVWCTMGNDTHMYHKKHGSTKWEINGEKLYWPGNDHSLVIVGYSLSRRKIYLADPEVNSDKLRERDLYEFENRFTELYSQSILILKKRATR